MEICYLAQGGSGRGGEEWGDVGGVLEGKFGGLGSPARQKVSPYSARKCGMYGAHWVEERESGKSIFSKPWNVIELFPGLAL